MNRFARRWLFYLLYLGLILKLTVFSLPYLPVNTQTTNTIKTAEVRGVWLTNVASGVFFVPWGINRALNQLSRLNFNTIYPVVWNRGYTFYNSSVAKKITGSDSQPLLKLMHGGRDVLTTLIKLSQAKG